ncbi:MAG: hypothetical protein ACJ72W_24610 [Actinoallomurus sp.]
MDRLPRLSHLTTKRAAVAARFVVPAADTDRVDAVETIAAELRALADPARAEQEKRGTPTG